MNDVVQRWQLQQPGAVVRVFLLAITVVLPLAIAAGALLHAFSGSRQLNLVADSQALTFSVVMLGVAALVMPLGWFLWRAAGRHRVTLDLDSVEVATTFYRRKLALSALRVDEARVVDLDERTELRPFLKTNATWLPGLRSGWFRLRNRSKALVATLGDRRVLWIPTRDGYDLLLQPNHPQALLDELKTRVGRVAKR